MARRGNSSREAGPSRISAQGDLSDAELALKLQLEEAGASSLSQTALAALLSPGRTQVSSPFSKKQCPVCLERFAIDLLQPLGPCGHTACSTCSRRYVLQTARTSKVFPIPCPECRAPLDPGLCLEMFQGDSANYETVSLFLTEKLHMSHVRYCANERCGAVFDVEENPEAIGTPEENMLVCPLCHMASCSKCRVEWHSGLTCDQFKQEVDQATNRSALQNLARLNNWRPCPGCEELIEKQVGDCNFVKCRCGVAFCHHCGVAYKSESRTEENEHGVAGCSCGLWSYETENENLGELALGEVRNVQRGDDDVQFLGVEPAAPARPVVDAVNPDVVVRREAPRVQPQPSAAIPNEPAVVEPFRQATPPSRRVDIEQIIQNARSGRRPLSADVLADFLESRCPYPECKRQFGSSRALEQHLFATGTHDVFVCCGRVFCNRRSQQQHINAIDRLGLQHF